MAQTTDFPKSPPSTPTSPPPVGAPVISSSDVGRALDLLIFHLTVDMRFHPDDLNELGQISARIKASTAH
jgi:hypothetical protein